MSIFDDGLRTIRDINGKKFIIKRIVNTSEDGCKLVVELIDDTVRTITIC